MTQPQSTTDDRRVGVLVRAYGEDGILRDYIADGTILLNPDGSIPSGDVGAITIADGADVTQGAKADAAYTDTTGAAAGSVIAIIKGWFVLAAARWGSLTEAAPATDTASSGLNGRLQRIAQRLTSLIALIPASLGAKAGTGSLSTVPATDARFVLANAVGIPAGAQTYSAFATAYTAYATPTDFFEIKGSAGKTIAVISLAIAAQATAAILGSYYWIKRSAANTGGTFTAPSAVSYDSGDAAASATLSLYSAAPTLGAAAGTVGFSQVGIQAPTSSPGWSTYPIVSNGGSMGAPITTSDTRKPIILRGVAESLCLNFNGAALPVGAVFQIYCQWVEF